MRNCINIIIINIYILKLKHRVFILRWFILQFKPSAKFLKSDVSWIKGA